MPTQTTNTAPASEQAIAGLELENRVVVFTDIVGSTALIEVHGDRAWIGTLTAHLEHAASQADRFGGEYMKTTGDGMLAVFEDCPAASAFAREMMSSPVGLQRLDNQLPVQLRIGIACGTVYRWNDDYFGRTVHLAARVCGAAQPGEILMSATCTEVCRDLLVSVEARRPVELRGFSSLESVCTDSCRTGDCSSKARHAWPAIESAGGTDEN